MGSSYTPPTSSPGPLSGGPLGSSWRGKDKPVVLGAPGPNGDKSLEEYKRRLEFYEGLVADQDAEDLAARNRGPVPEAP